MEKEKAIKHLEVIKGDCALVGDIHALDMAISALSTEGEYIRKADMERILYSTNNAVRIGELFTELPTYSFPDSAEINGDLISRQAVENITWEEPSYTDPLNVLTEVREKVRALPSAENKGEWIYQQGIVPYKWRCNKCEKMFKTDFNYCPNCGADMRGET